MEIDKQIISQLVKERGITTVSEAEDLVKELLAPTIESLLEAELENELGYSKYDYKNKHTNNSRNGYTPKKIRTSNGEIQIRIPRDRNGDFEPIAVKKNQKDVCSIEERIISMYAKGMSTRDIQRHLKEIYGINVSPTLISNITDKVIPLITEWQNRPLQQIYVAVFLDAIRYKVIRGNQVVDKAAYISIGIDLEGSKDVLGIWIDETEKASFWLSVLNELRNRGVDDILILCVDNLKGVSEAIKACYPEAEIQKCIVHQIRNTIKFIPRKHFAEFLVDLKSIYRAATEVEGLRQLDLFEEKWGNKYPLAIKTWRTNWPELAVFFKYPPELRRLIYTTNVIEAFHRQLRKVTKSKSVFPNDESLRKMLYLATMDVMEKWSYHVNGWKAIMTQFCIFFGTRVTNHLH